MVDLTDYTCTCDQFQLESFSCKHTIAVTIYRGFAARILYSPYYIADYRKVAYAKTIFSPLNEVAWKVFYHILPFYSLLASELPK